MKKIVLGLVLLGLLTMVVWKGFFFYQSVQQINILVNQADLSEISLKFQPNNQQLKVTLAKSEASRAKGLGERAALSNDGMLFFFPTSDRWQFWMKGMQFPLDFVWIQDQRIVGITAKVPAPVPASDKPNGDSIYWTAPVNFVLELPAGKAQALGLQVGDTLQFIKPE